MLLLLLWLAAGLQNPSNPKLLDEAVLLSAVLAVEPKPITATLWQVPNQPIVFADDPTHQRRSEVLCCCLVSATCCLKGDAPLLSHH